MVFVRRRKTSINKALIGFALILVLILSICACIVNVVFAATFSIPVEINWDDQGVSAGTRPTQVILRLRRTGSNSILGTLTLTASNQDPNNSNKWVGEFRGITYNSSYTYVVSQDSFNDYIIGGPSTISVSNNTHIDTYTVADSSVYQNSASTNLGNITYFLYNKNGTYYLYTRQRLNETRLASFNQAISAKLGTTVNVTSSNTLYGNSTYDSNITVNVRSNNVTVAINRNAGISAAYYGTYSDATGSVAIFTNTLQAATCTLTVHHLNEDNTTFAADTVTSYTCGDTYTASPISDPDYTPELTIGQATGTIAQDTEVTYVYHPKFHDVIYQFTGSVQPPNASLLLPATVTYNDGDTVTVAPEPTAPQGYRFLGWQMNGQSISGTFTMPSQDVTITGSWEQFNGYFAPTISKQITNVQNDPYRFGDTVEFQITVTNTANFPITNVHVTENLLGANFVADSGYTLSSDTEAVIASIPANSSVILTAEYEIPDDVTGTRTNTVEITSASASNYYFLDTTQDYTASVQFATQSWQDVPVLTGVKTNGTILYFVLMFLGAIGIGGSIVAHQVNIKEREK